MAPLPIILCGKREQVAAGVIENLKPDYEVIHLILTREAGCAQIPAILAGQSAPSNSTLGTMNYASPPVAILLGAGYQGDDVAIMMEETAKNSAAKPVPWFRPDMSKPSALSPLDPAYGKAAVDRFKVAAKQLQEAGKMNEATICEY